MTATPGKILILGATSGIAEATARLYATEGADLLLAARNNTRLKQMAADLKVRGATGAETFEVDFSDGGEAEKLAQMAGILGGADHILIAFGVMTEQAQAEHNLASADQMMSINFNASARWALAAANLLEAQGHGALVVLGSPAGDRGRRKNYIYGATKAGLGVLVQGIAHRFAGKGPRCVLLKPGPTATAMTADMNQKGLASPEEVAKAIRRAADRGGPIQYSPAKWRLIMRIVREIPSPIFDRLNF